MSSTETHTGPTPNGGVKAVVNYRSKSGKPVAKKRAEACEIIEYDKEGNVVGRTYGIMESNG